MWFFTKYGFYACACARQEDRPNSPPDPSTVVIRGRSRQQMENLKTRFPDLLQNVELWEDVNADYKFRFFVPKETFVKIVAALSLEMDYDRFKPEAFKYPGGKDYHDDLIDVWNLLYQRYA